MQLINQATAGLRKQIKEHKDAIKELEAEIKLIEKDFGVTEHPLLAIIRKQPRLRKLKLPTDEQCQTLYTLYGEPKVVEYIEKMDDWRDINKHTYFYSTINNWLKRDRDKAIEKAQPTGNVIKDEAWTKVRDEIRESGVDKAEYKPGWLTGELK